MWRKILLSSSLAIGLMGVGISTVSADMITSPDGLVVSQPTKVGIRYDTVVSDLSPEDYKVTVTKQSDNQTIDQSAKNKSQQIGNEEIQGGKAPEYVVSVELTDQGKAKVKARTGVTNFDANTINLVAAIPSSGGDGFTYGSTAGSNSDQAPVIKNAAVMVRQDAGNNKEITSETDARDLIIDARHQQSKEQAQYPISDNTKELLQNAQTGPQAGIDIDLSHVDRQKQALDMIDNKKDRAKAKQQQDKQTAKSIGWQTLGIVILGVLGSFVAWVGYYLTKHRRK